MNLPKFPPSPVCSSETPYPDLMAKKSVPTFPAHILEGIGEVLGDTVNGLSGSEMGRLLAQTRIHDVEPTETKRFRLYYALLGSQRTTGSGQATLNFIVTAMAPSRYRDKPAAETWRRDELNQVLVHEGLRVTESGEVAKLRAGKAKTRGEAAERASTIRRELQRRNTHATVLQYCTEELLHKNNFHAVLEAAKSVPDRLRAMSMLRSDGAELANATLFPKATPQIAINDLADDTDIGEQAGFGNLVKGLLSLYRNPTAHTPKIRRQVSDDELLEALTTLSMVHRRLDTAAVRPPVAP
ncbi:putative Phage protein [Candidatus Microthrix parvicella RN1]|uniref:Putative Phage protein n=2 Tax=Candidatus Neomicrothrix TaxID=41949 RepID=R4Z3G4_9ACTN|nr:putative Phage protein [Candidatus Microthrix parvicella RN1]